MSFDLLISDGDLVIRSGALATVINAQKLSQDILKICLTAVGSNPIHPTYGSYLSRSVIGNAMKSSVVVQIAQSQINTCLTNLQSIQANQVKNFQQVSADEQLASVLGISVLRSTADPRNYNVKISVLTKGFLPVNTGFTVSPI